MNIYKLTQFRKGDFMLSEIKHRGRPRKYDDPKEAQRIANQRYRARHRQQVNYLNDRNKTKQFILKEATDEDLTLVDQWRLDRRQLDN